MGDASAAAATIGPDCLIPPMISHYFGIQKWHRRDGIPAHEKTLQFLKMNLTLLNLKDNAAIGPRDRCSARFCEDPPVGGLSTLKFTLLWCTPAQSILP